MWCLYPFSFLLEFFPLAFLPCNFHTQNHYRSMEWTMATQKSGRSRFSKRNAISSVFAFGVLQKTTGIKLLWLRLDVKVEWRWVCKLRLNCVCVTLAGFGIWGMLETLPRSSQGILCLCYAFVYVGLFLIQAEGWEEKCGVRVCMTHAVIKACRGQGCKLHAHFIFRR